MLPSDAVEEGFWKAIAEAPEDEVPRLIFADWLEERNDPRGPLLRERRYWPHLNANCRDPVQVVLAILDGGPAGSLKPLLQAAAMVGAPLVPELLERCRATPSSHHAGALTLLAALSSDCLLPILPDLIGLLPRHGAAIAPVLAQLGAAAVTAVPALLEAERSRALDRMTLGYAISRIGPAAGSPAVAARLVDVFCDEKYPDPRAAIAEALAVVALPWLEDVLGNVLERVPAHFTALAWKLVSDKKPAPDALRKALRSADECVRWGAACALVRGSANQALPHLLDALRRAPQPLLQPVVTAMRLLNQEVAEALPLLRDLLGRPELPFAELLIVA